ncbi:MAG: 50S ribosomal protein L22 [candidate division Zixibacteria bacterium]|nr:50S ribosomal protein L22 [candidate division Zixibacteria bacterium]
MEAKATLRFIRMSPRKIRRVAALIKGRGYIDAKARLTFLPKAASQVLLSTMKSAAANAISREGSAKVKVENLYVKDVWVDGGPIMKRIRPVAMGRAFRIRKRTSHINIVLAEKPTTKSPEKEA